MTTQEAFTNLREKLDSFFSLICHEFGVTKIVKWMNTELEKWK